jgi:hypothetical protein
MAAKDGSRLCAGVPVDHHGSPVNLPASATVRDKRSNPVGGSIIFFRDKNFLNGFIKHPGNENNQYRQLLNPASFPGKATYI